MKHKRSAMGEVLAAGVSQLPFTIEASQQEKLLDYLGLLIKWNAVYNLTAVRDPEKMVVQHLLDSLAAVPAFENVHQVLDVGTGGGLPGIVLAIVRPQLQVSLIDTVQKKTAFLNQVKAELGLTNVTVHTGRVEQLQPTQKFDAITSRAFAELADFVQLSSHLLADDGCFIALKGVFPQDEIARLPEGWEVIGTPELSVPGMSAQRHLILIKRKTR